MHIVTVGQVLDCHRLVMAQSGQLSGNKRLEAEITLDGTWFHVTHNGEWVKSTKSIRQAVAAYNKIDEDKQN